MSASQPDPATSSPPTVASPPTATASMTPQQIELAKSELLSKDRYMARWDHMHFALATLVVLVAAVMIGIFAWRGDVQGMSSAGAIVSGWVGGVLGWYFTKVERSQTPGPSPAPAGQGPAHGGP